MCPQRTISLCLSGPCVFQSRLWQGDFAHSTSPQKCHRSGHGFVSCLFKRFKVHLILPSINRIARSTTLVKAVQSALGSENIFLWSSDINIKAPNSIQYFPYHQDATYAGLEPAKNVACFKRILASLITTAFNATELFRQQSCPTN